MTHEYSLARRVSSLSRYEICYDIYISVYKSYTYALITSMQTCLFALLRWQMFVLGWQFVSGV